MQNIVVARAFTLSFFKIEVIYGTKIRPPPLLKNPLIIPAKNPTSMFFQKFFFFMLIGFTFFSILYKITFFEIHPLLFPKFRNLEL